jgi:pimeloyl-ACP methyl ester carboxylesterase
METAIFLPGVITPAEVVYQPLVPLIDQTVRPILKELELYARGQPPDSYSIKAEIVGIERLMAAEGLEQAHLVGYSGGAAICLAFIAAHPQRVKSLAMFEPAAILTKEAAEIEAEEWAETERIIAKPEYERLTDFIRSYLKPGVEMPPPQPSPPPSWMASRPAGMRALVRAFREYRFSPDDLKAFTRPVYLAIGGLSRVSEERKAQFLRQLLPQTQLEVYPDLHHFNPPQRAEPERFAQSLLKLWASTEEA